MAGAGRLREACLAGDCARVQYLLSTNAAEPDDARQALRESKNNPPILRILLENGVDPADLTLSTVRNASSLRILAEFGYDIQSQGHRVLQDFSDDCQTIDWLLDQGVDINGTDTGRTASGSKGHSARYDWSNHLLNNVAAAGDMEFFDHLVARGADPHASLALHYASKCQDPERCTAMISHLLDTHGMDIHSDTDALRDFFHDAPDAGTPLCTAIHRQNLAAVKELLRRGSSVEECGESGYDPVYKAVGDALSDGFLPALEPLLDAGADPDLALEYAVTQYNLEAARIALRFGPSPARALKQAQDQEAERACTAAEGAHDQEQQEAQELETSSQAMIELLCTQATK